MRLSRIALSATALGLVLALAAQAQAQQPRRVLREGPNTERITVVDETGRVRTRITVRPRSFLDPGKETLAFDQHYHDYAVTPGQPIGYPATLANDWRFSNSRMPLPGAWDVPGYIRP
jgi:hypothetical protein